MPTDQPHICTAETCPDGQKYYVSAREAGRTYLMAGPYSTHREALTNVDQALHIADEHDGRAWFMSWGTVAMPSDSPIIGQLHRLALMPPHDSLLLELDDCGSCCASHLRGYTGECRADQNRL